MGKKRRKSKKKSVSSTPSKVVKPKSDSSAVKSTSSLLVSNKEETITQQAEQVEQAEQIEQGLEIKQHPLLVQAGVAFNDGNYQHVHYLIDQLSSYELNQDDQDTLDHLRNRLSFDSVALWFPIGLFILWAFLFYRSLY
jgi:hypothetical protein